MESRAKGWAVSLDALRKQLGSPRISSADDLVTYQGENECGARSGLNSDLAVCRGCLSLRTCFGSLCEPLLWIVSCPKDGTVGQRLDYERGQPSTAYPHCPINSNRKRIRMTILRFSSVQFISFTLTSPFCGICRLPLFCLQLLVLSCTNFMKKVLSLTSVLNPPLPVSGRVRSQLWPFCTVGHSTREALGCLCEIYHRI
jgi:hypothetical protein